MRVTKPEPTRRHRFVGKRTEWAVRFPGILDLALASGAADIRELAGGVQKVGNRMQGSRLLTTGNGMRGEADFEKLVDQHQASLYRFALSLSRNESDACDLVQDAFYLWATKGRHQLEDAAKVKGWLFTTLHREFLGKRRRVVRFPHHELAEVEEELPDVPPQLPAGPDWELVLDCLGRVDAAFRGPVALFYLEDYSYNEIAEILEVPLGTVKSRIARGVAQLQRMFSEDTASPINKD